MKLMPTMPRPTTTIFFLDPAAIVVQQPVCSQWLVKSSQVKSESNQLNRESIISQAFVKMGSMEEGEAVVQERQCNCFGGAKLTYTDGKH